VVGDSEATFLTDGLLLGTTRVPLGGFTELQGVQGVQRFSIHKAYGDPNRLPQAHTCK